MNTAEYVTSLIAGKVVELALLGTGLKMFLTLASRLSLAAVKAPAVPKTERETKAETPPAPEADETAPIPLGRAS